MKNIRKFISAVLVGSLLLSMSFISGCKNPEYTVALNEIRYVNEDDPWYDTTVINTNLEEYGLYISYCSVLYSGEDFFIVDVSGSTMDPDNWYEKDFIYKYSYDGELLGTFDFAALNPDMDDYPVKCYEYNGEIYYLVNYQTWDDGSGVEQEYCVCTIDYETQTLEIQNKLDFSDWYKGFPVVKDIAVSGDYVVYLLTRYDEMESAFYVFDMRDGSHYIVDVLKDTDYLDFWFERSNMPCDGAIYYYAERSEDNVVYSFDPELGKYEVERVMDYFGEDMYIMGDGTYLTQDGNIIIKKDIKTGEEIEVVSDVFCSSVSPAFSDLNYLYAYSGDTVVLRADEINNALGYQRIKLYLLNKSDINPHAGKQIVTLGYSDFGVDSFMGNLVEMNNSNYDSEYYIQVINDYDMSDMSKVCDDEEITFDEYYVKKNDQLISDIREGSGPDIVVGGARFSSANPSLIYADLAPIMEADSAFSSDDYSAAVTKGFEADGGIYHVPYGVTICGLAILDKQYDGKGFTYEEYVDFVNCHMNGHDPLGKSDQYNPPIEDFEYFQHLFSICASDFMVDGKLDITSEENGEKFAQMAELVMNRDIVFHSEDGELINARTLGVSNFYTYIDATVFTKSSTPTNIVGIPSYDGRGAYSLSDYTVAITTCSADKEAAWSIIRQLLSYDVQSVTPELFAPVRLDALEAGIDEQIRLMECGESSLWWTWYDQSFDFKPFREKYVDMICNLDTFVYVDPMIILIMSE
ncbi:MAG: hypothetical protein MJ093_09045 [Saccharofermentans sp.]|nr:hypothetical protein [Saccharofermentans sp.]